MRLLAKATLVIASLAVPLSAWAVPPNVTGIRASLEGGRVRVIWDKPPADDIAYYRVFFSHASILGNGGLYDDFDVADAVDTEHLLASVPPAQTLYVSVLAVNAQGEESALFTEEASVVLVEGGDVPPIPQAASSAADAASSSIAAQDAATQQLFQASALTATGVRLTFSHTVVLQPSQAAQAFTIRDASGSSLSLLRLVIEGKTVTIHTEPQTRDRVYQVRVSSVVGGRTADEQPVPLDAGQPPVLFIGASDGIAPAQSQPQPAAPAAPQNVTGLRLTATPEQGGTYTVEARWMAPEGAAGYRIAQTTDRGRTFDPEQPAPATTNAIVIRGVAGGTHFGVGVRTEGADGSLSSGVLEFLELPASLPTSPVTGSVTGGGSTRLPNSGVGLASAIMMGGAALGASVMRRRKAASVKA